MFIAALFTIAKRRRQHSCLLTDEQKKMIWHIRNGMLLSHQKNEILPFVTTWMDLERIMLSEISQTDKDKYHMISLKNKTNEQTTKQKLTHRFREQTGGCQGGEGWGDE